MSRDVFNSNPKLNFRMSQVFTKGIWSSGGYFFFLEQDEIDRCNGIGKDYYVDLHS